MDGPKGKRKVEKLLKFAEQKISDLAKTALVNLKCVLVERKDLVFTLVSPRCSERCKIKGVIAKTSQLIHRGSGLPYVHAATHICFKHSKLLLTNLNPEDRDKNS